MYPKLFTIGWFSVPTYGVLVALGFLAGLSIALRLGKRTGLSSEPLTNLAIYCALGGMPGRNCSCSCSTGSITAKSGRDFHAFDTAGRRGFTAVSSWLL